MMNEQADNAPAGVSDWVERIVRDEVRALSSYHVPGSAGMIKLDAMENPYGLPADVQAEIGAIVAQAPLNRYPDADASELKAMLREVMAVPEGMDVLLGNGSDEIIQLLCQVCARPGAVMLGVEPSFVMYTMVARICGLRSVSVPLTPDYRLDVEAVLAAMAEHRPALSFFAYPNNPTGNLFDADGLARIVRASPGLVIIDEAYHPFAQASFMPRLGEFPNLLVIRTVSKLGLAGLRLGLIAGRSEWLAELDKARLPYNLNVLTQRVARCLLGHHVVLDTQAEAICRERGKLSDGLRGVRGAQVYRSDANFILFKVANAAAVFEALKQRGILIKKLAGSHPALQDGLRVTVGTPEENEAFLRALNESVDEVGKRHA
jgi:histidinol-phosphate aminotransferase